VPFDERSDYASYVDGKPRQEGYVTSSPPQTSRFGRAHRTRHRRTGVEVFPGSVAWVRAARGRSETAVVSSSRNCAAVLEDAGITNLFDTRVDGDTALVLHLPGKPAPDAFLEAARRLKVAPARTVVVDDAIVGVRAGRADEFGLGRGCGGSPRWRRLVARHAALGCCRARGRTPRPGGRAGRARRPDRRRGAAGPVPERSAGGARSAPASGPIAVCVQDSRCKPGGTEEQSPSTSVRRCGPPGRRDQVGVRSG
jgi:HAD superfamily hydrolase (TIGR01509 family)